MLSQTPRPSVYVLKLVVVCHLDLRVKAWDMHRSSIWSYYSADSAMSSVDLTAVTLIPKNVDAFLDRISVDTASCCVLSISVNLDSAGWVPERQKV